MNSGLKKKRRRILSVLRETGARKRTVLDGIAGGDREPLDSLIADGSVRVKPRTSKRGTLYVAT